VFVRPSVRASMNLVGEAVLARLLVGARFWAKGNCTTSL